MVGTIDAHKELWALDGCPGQVGVIAGVTQQQLKYVNLREASLWWHCVLLAIGELGDALDGMDCNIDYSLFRIIDLGNLQFLFFEPVLFPVVFIMAGVFLNRRVVGIVLSLLAAVDCVMLDVGSPMQRGWGRGSMEVECKHLLYEVSSSESESESWCWALRLFSPELVSMWDDSLERVDRNTDDAGERQPLRMLRKKLGSATEGLRHMHRIFGTCSSLSLCASIFKGMEELCLHKAPFVGATWRMDTCSSSGRGGVAVPWHTGG
jgi:hypothetical protein